MKNDNRVTEIKDPDRSEILNVFLKEGENGICLLKAEEEIRIAYANKGFWRMLGREGSSGTGTFSELGISLDDEIDYVHRLRNCTEKGSSVTMLQRISGNGTDYIWRRVKTVRLDQEEDGCPLMLEISEEVSALIDTQEQLRESNERLKVMLAQSAHVLWEVDIPGRSFALYDGKESPADKKIITEDFPEGMIKDGVIHPDSAANFRKFSDALLKGKEADYGNFIMKNKEASRYEWVSLFYHILCDRHGEPVKAVGVQEKLPNVAGTMDSDYLRRPLPEVVRHSLLTRIRVNLTEDRMEAFWIDGADRTEWARQYSYSTLLEKEGRKMFLHREGYNFIEHFKRSALLEAFARGERWFIGDYRRIDAGGSVCWMRATVNLQCDRKKDVYMYACFTDARQKHEWEHLIRDEVGYDETGWLYSPRTTRCLTEKIIENAQGALCALAMIHISGGVEYMDDKNAEAGHRVQDFIGAAFSLALGGDCIMGRYSPERILVFFPEAGSKNNIKRRMEDAFAYLRAAMEDIPGMETLRFVAGAAVTSAEQADYDILLMQAFHLCNLWANAAMDMVVFSDEDENTAWESTGEAVNITALDEKKSSRGKSGEEYRTAFQCLAAMLDASSLEGSVNNVLRRIGRYYQADRSYIMIISEDRERVTLLYEWTKKGKTSIQQTALGIRMEKIPVLCQCMKKKAPVCLSKKIKGEENWNFIAFPLIQDGQTLGFLCVENGKAHLGELRLLRTVIPYLMKEHRRFHTKGTGNPERQTDSLSGLPNRREYDKRVHALNSDTCGSMGVLVLDVPNFSVINSTRGFEYGHEMLLFIVKTLESFFGRERLFRIWDTEFAVLFPDTIKEPFLARCERLRNRLQRRYPQQIRIGYTWTDGIFSGKNLVREAQNIMQCESRADPGKYGMEELVPAVSNNKDQRSVKKYIPYFQPKIDMRDGSLIGAEALVRGIDGYGNIVKPEQFVEEMERNGQIRDLDYFMLESVLRQMSGWKDKGYPPITVSVNISRNTLFSPTVLASVLAIQSRYPDISPENLELEITETAGSVETETLGDIINNFRRFHIRFELDDFGSQYANIAIFSNIRFQTIKLDRSLINDLPGNDISRMMVENIAGICKNFGMGCVAEGVETSQQKEILLAAGCVCGQGYLYSRPLPAWEFEERYLKNTEKQQ